MATISYDLVGAQDFEQKERGRCWNSDPLIEKRKGLKELYHECKKIAERALAGPG